MKVGNKHYRTVWMEGRTVKLIDQTKLPFRFEIYSCRTHRQTADAIRTMVVRGAGAIGVTAGYGMAQAVLEAPDNNFIGYIERAAELINETRPTAQNLFYAVERVLAAARSALSLTEARETAVKIANSISDEDAAAGESIGKHGNKLIKSGMRVLTHCNAGWLAFADWGSALALIYVAHRSGKNVFVWVDETRPRSQGAKLTSWELMNENVPHAIIADNAAGHYMQRGMVDMVIVGADRIAANGDVANKIGTYEKAVLAREHKVPFYVAAPTTTFDLKCTDGKNIVIEERDQDEVLTVTGEDRTGKLVSVRIAPGGATAKNPAFDVTPAKYIKGIITEKGIVKPDRTSIKRLFANA